MVSERVSSRAEVEFNANRHSLPLNYDKVHKKLDFEAISVCFDDVPDEQFFNDLLLLEWPLELFFWVRPSHIFTFTTS